MKVLLFKYDETNKSYYYYLFIYLFQYNFMFMFILIILITFKPIIISSYVFVLVFFEHDVS